MHSQEWECRLRLLLIHYKEKMKEFEITVSDVKTAAGVNRVLTLVDEKDMRPITERIKSYEDACRVLGKEVDDFSDEPKDIQAYKKLRIITEALNEDKEFPRFDDKETRWFPYFHTWTIEEVNRMTDSEKSRLCGTKVNTVNGGIYVFVDSGSDHTFMGCLAAYGSHYAYKNRILSDYSAKQFAQLWYDFLRK